ncbi:hypothetical protein N9341_04980 [Candidatus Pelagibacter sp.]|nr:hypothetical protein [Candidatus Pelagibacter sp.]
MKNYLVTTKKTQGIYKIILESCQKHLNKISKKKGTINLIYLNSVNKILSVNIFIFLLHIFFYKIFNFKKLVELKYRNYEVGMYAASETFRNHKVFNSKLTLYYIMIKNLLIVSRQIERSISIAKNSVAIYVDHVGYISGAAIQVFAKEKKIVYGNGHPRGLFFVDFSKKTTTSLFDIIKIKKDNKKKRINRALIKKKFAGVMNYPKNNLSWMKYADYSKLNKKKFLKLNLESFDYIIYSHSFVDGQLFFGYDEFSNLKEWLEFTIEYLKKRNKKILIKPHPNFYNKTFNKIAKYDREIFLEIKKKYENDSVIFLDTPIENNEILKRVKKEVILISHHGTAILEGAFLGFKTICSRCTLWEKKFNISNQWENIESYKKVLDLKPRILKNFKNSDDFFEISKKLFFNKYAFGGKLNYEKIIENFTKPINWSKANTNPNLLLNLIKNKKQFSNITNKISKNIEEI